jgi:hypothetical protein
LKEVEDDENADETKVVPRYDGAMLREGKTMGFTKTKGVKN